MEGPHSGWIRNFFKALSQGSGGQKFLSWGPGAKPQLEVLGQSPKAEEKWEVIVQCLTFSCIRFRV